MEQQILPQGTIIGGRFEIEAVVEEDRLGRVYRARDTKADKTVVLRVLGGEIVSEEKATEHLRARVKDCSALKHRNIRATFGMGVEENGSVYIATEWIEGSTLRALLKKRAEEKKRFSFKGAYNIMGHVCNALDYAHARTYHGAIDPSTIIVNAAGRVKIGAFEVAELKRRNLPDKKDENLETTFWAPEVVGEADSVTKQADIFSLGALFYELISGVPPARPLKAPSLMGFSRDVDTVIARCMAGDPKQRYSDPQAVKAAVAELVRAHQSDVSQMGTDDNLGIDVEVDLTVLGEGSKPKKQPSPAKNQPKADKEAASAKKGSMLQAPGLPPPPSSTVKGDAAGRFSTVDMGEVLSGLSKNEAAHWMVQKDKFDHGPFTDRELVQMILLGEVLGKHQLLDMDTGVRQKVRVWGKFDEYLERYRIKKKEQEEKLALQRTERAETRGNAFKIILAAAILGVIGLAVGGYFLSRKLREEKTYTPDEMIAALDSGEIKLRTGGNLIDTKKRRGRRRGGGRRGGGGGGEFVDGMSYEDAMNMAVDLGGLKNTGGQKQLTPQEITRIMDRNVRRFLPCMAGQSVKKVSMDLAIAGDGRVIGISVNEGSAKLKKCVASKVRSIKFPTSPAPRTAASWYFEIY